MICFLHCNWYCLNLHDALAWPLSFVIYCKVPPEIFKVQADSNAKKAGQILFHYGDSITKLMGSEWPVTPYENLMFIFPNELEHSVPPYWVDAERISVSGNFILV